MISIISAVAENGVIGVKNELPWKLSGDLKYFAKTTTGKTVLMGRNTFFSIVKMIGKPLPNRKNIVLSEIDDGITGAKVVKSWQEVVDLAKNEEIFVIGGASVYKQALPFADRLYITRVYSKCEGDAFFPEIDEKIWKITKTESHPADEKNQYPYSFQIYEKR